MRISHALIVLLFALFFANGPVLAACAEADKDCMEKLKEAWNEVNEEQDSSTTSAVDRVEAVGKAVKDCVECATETVVQSIQQVGTEPTTQPADEDPPN